MARKQKLGWPFDGPKRRSNMNFLGGDRTRAGRQWNGIKAILGLTFVCAVVIAGKCSADQNAPKHAAESSDPQPVEAPKPPPKPAAPARKPPAGKPAHHDPPVQ